MKVLCGEGIANHTGAESCIVHREVHGEALTGESVASHKGGSTYGLRAAAIRVRAVALRSGPASRGERTCKLTKAPLMGSLQKTDNKAR